MIWNYIVNRLLEAHSVRDVIEHLWYEARNTNLCLFCSEPLHEVFRYQAKGRIMNLYYDVISSSRREVPQSEPTRVSEFSLLERRLDLVEAIEKVCPCCGWWIAFRDYYQSDGSVSSHGGIGSLLTLDLCDLSTPLREIRAYLTANYEKRHRLHPRLFEETVASVFRDLGFQTRVTAYSNDGGIDIVLDGSDGNVIGVQVKRYHDRIDACQIRELTGALVLRGITRGVFVTTSSYKPGAESEAKASQAVGIPIELYNASRFYDALKIAQRVAYNRENLEDAPFRIVSLPEIGIQRPNRRSTWFKP